MSPERLSSLRQTCRDGLLNDVVPFGTRSAVDSEFGGFLTCLDRQGRVIDTDKAIGLQGRMSWLYATLYSEVEPRGGVAMKFWWPHNEAIIATLLAWQLTRDEKYLRWHEQVHDWSHVHFPDPEFGEWYGYLHRDGRVSTTLKGNMWKSAFHLSRMQLLCWQILEEELSATNSISNL